MRQKFSINNIEFVLYWHLLLDIGPALMCGLNTYDTPLETTSFSFVSGYQLEIASMLGEGACTYFPSAVVPHLAKTCTGPVHAAPVSVGSSVLQSCCVWKT